MNTIYPVSFTSRKPIIRDADRVCRSIKTEFNAISPTMLRERLKGDEKEDNLCKKFGGIFKDLLFQKDKEIGEFRDGVYYKSDKRFEIMNKLKIFKVMNCGENAEMARITAILNGAKDVNCFAVFSHNEKTDKITNLDHLVTVLNFKLPEYCNFYDSKYQYILKEDLITLPKNAIIIDPWVGFADYVENSVTKFKHDYQKIFEIEPNEKIRFVPMDFPEISEDDLYFIKKYFPNLLLKNINLNA